MTHLAVAQENAVPGMEPLNLGPIHFINFVRGFSRVFWGLALTAVLFLSQARLEVFSSVRLPVYFLGVALHGWGLLTLRNTGKISARWNFCIVLAILLALLQIYFFPFVRWWRTMPYISFFAFNVGALAVTVILLLYFSNIIAADFFRHLSLKGERLEAQIYAAAVMVFMAAPLLAAVVFALIAARHYQTVFLDELIAVVYRAPIWLDVVVTIPYSLTLTILWKARDRSYQRFCREKETIK